MAPYLPRSPRVLVDLHQYKHINRGHATLGRLLTDATMERPWGEIGKRISTDDDYMRLWSEVNYRLQMCRRVKDEESRAKKRARFEQIGMQVRRLANAIENEPLDFQVYEYFPSDVMGTLGARHWPTLNPFQKSTFASSLLPEWPTLCELLSELEARCIRMANDALTEDRIVERKTRDQQTNYFIRAVSRYFRANLRGSMHGSVAAIAAVTLQQTIDEESVRQALRQTRG